MLRKVLLTSVIALGFVMNSGVADAHKMMMDNDSMMSSQMMSSQMMIDKSVGIGTNIALHYTGFSSALLRACASLDKMSMSMSQMMDMDMNMNMHGEHHVKKYGKHNHKMMTMMDDVKMAKESIMMIHMDIGDCRDMIMALQEDGSIDMNMRKMCADKLNSLCDKLCSLKKMKMSMLNKWDSMDSEMDSMHKMMMDMMKMFCMSVDEMCGCCIKLCENYMAMMKCAEMRMGHMDMNHDMMLKKMNCIMMKKSRRHHH